MGRKLEILDSIDSIWIKTLERKGFNSQESIFLHLTLQIFPLTYIKEALEAGEKLEASVSLFSVKFKVPISTIYSGANRLEEKGYLKKRSGGYGNFVQYILNVKLLHDLFSDLAVELGTGN